MLPASGTAFAKDPAAFFAAAAGLLLVVAGVVVLLLSTSGLDRFAKLGAAASGAAVATVLILFLSGRGGHAPERVLTKGSKL